MAITIQPVAGIEPCAACGHVQNPALRWKYLAGCPDDHCVDSAYSIMEIAEVLAHRWPDKTYAAVKFDHPDDLTEERALSWLDRCHSGDVERRDRELGVQVTFDVWSDKDERKIQEG